MKATLLVLNDLQQTGFISRYAIGGAVAAIFYAEPVDTEDLDIFVHLENPSHPLMPMGHLYEELRRRGYGRDGIYDLIEGVPVQFLPDSPILVEEAVAEANEIDFDGVPTYIPKPEHLLAIMVNTGRPKDRIRALQFLEQCDVDRVKLQEILSRHNLLGRFTQWTTTPI